MPLEPEILELLRDLAAALSGRRWYIFGAQAANLWGRPRLSGDVDVTVELDEAERPHLVGGLRAAGFELRVP